MGFWPFLIKVFEVETFSIPPFLMMKTFTSLIASIVDSLVVNPWILKRCLLIENPRSGSAFLWQRMSTQLARATSVRNFFFPSSSIIYLTYRVNIYETISSNVALKGSLPECTAFVIVKQFFLWKSLLLCGSRLLKKTHFLRFEISLPQARK